MSAQTSDSPLRVVLLLDAPSLARWAASIVSEMREDPKIHVVGVVYDDRNSASGGATVPRRSFVSRLANAWRHRDSVLLNRYLRFDARRYPAIGTDPFEEIDVTSILGDLPTILARPSRKRFSDYFDEPSLTELRALAPDVCVRFGFRILRGEILGLPRFGVWSFHHGDNRVNRGGPAGFWEVLLGWRATGAVLQRLSEDLDGGVPLARTWIATNPISVHQNRIELFAAAAPLLMRKLRDVQRRGQSALAPTRGEPTFVPYSDRLFVAPTVWQLALGILRISWRLTARKWHAMRYVEQWQLEMAIDTRKAAANNVPQSAPFRGKQLTPPMDRFWADPFPVLHQDRRFVFFEELVHTEGLGRIVVMEIGLDGACSPARVVLKRPYHLSYPTVIVYGGEHYLLAEMAAHGRQELFRATNFPYEWEYACDFDLDQVVVDPTILEHDGLWWLFVGTAPSQEAVCSELSIYYSTSPLSGWRPHPMNPVVSDARSARPAGQLFRSGEDLVRPSQDCTPQYGSAIVFKRVRKLTIHEYEEETIGRFDPHWREGLVGTHTVNAAGGVTMIDARVSRLR
jgi:hypothetical protein